MYLTVDLRAKKFVLLHITQHGNKFSIMVPIQCFVSVRYDPILFMGIGFLSFIINDRNRPKEKQFVPLLVWWSFNNRNKVKCAGKLNKTEYVP